MGTITPLNPKSRTTLREAYRSALAGGYNASVDSGKYDRACAQTMVGFLSAAVIALRLAGDEVWATLFERSARRLDDDWQCYQHEVPALFGVLDSI